VLFFEFGRLPWRQAVILTPNLSNYSCSHQDIGARVFNINVEDIELKDVDIVEQSGAAKTAMTLEVTVVVDDGMLNMAFKAGKKDNPKLSAIEVKLADHL
jgi:Malectin domain